MYIAIRTDLSRNLSPEDEQTIETTAPGDGWVNADQGTSTILVAAFDPALNGRTSTIYLSDCQIVEPAPHARDVEIANRLWDLSNELTASKFD